jgi:N-acyl-D-amino-acid deacylase
MLLKGGLLVDGTGVPGREADVRIEGESIAEVGSGLRHHGEVIDCRGHAVAPGFIDTHSHSDVKVLAEPQLEEKLRQGITLEVLGQDGISVAPVEPGERASWKQKLSGLEGDFGVEWDWSSVASYLERIQAARPAQDLAYLAPHGALRQIVVGPDDRPASPEERARMQDLLRTALAEGACGFSTGLIYPPCCYADTAELISFGEVLAGAGRPLVVHIRSESDRMREALEEMVGVAGASGCAVQVSHLKLAGKRNWPRAEEMIGVFESARERGLRFTADQYPYTAGSTLLGAILPPWAHSGGGEATLRRLGDPEQRARLRAELSSPEPCEWDNFWQWSGPEGIVVSDIPSGRHPEWLGRNLAEIAAARRRPPLDAAFDLLREERMGVAMISFSQDEDVVSRFLELPWVNVCTDGLLGGRPHPRTYGTFPRILGRYVRERGLLALEEAVRKMTLQAAAAMGFRDCGRVAPGLRANLVVFDPETVADRATFEDPARHPVGIRDVIVGGGFAVRDGALTGERRGRVVR